MVSEALVQASDAMSQLRARVPLPLHPLIDEFVQKAPQPLAKPKSLERLLFGPDAAVTAVTLLRKAIQPADLTAARPQRNDKTIFSEPGPTYHGPNGSRSPSANGS